MYKIATEKNNSAQEMISLVGQYFQFKKISGWFGHCSTITYLARCHVQPSLAEIILLPTLAGWSKIEEIDKYNKTSPVIWKARLDWFWLQDQTKKSFFIQDGILCSVQDKLLGSSIIIDVYVTKYWLNIQKKDSLNKVTSYINPKRVTNILSSFQGPTLII